MEYYSYHVSVLFREHCVHITRPTPSPSPSLHIYFRWAPHMMLTPTNHQNVYCTNRPSYYIWYSTILHPRPRSCVLSFRTRMNEYPVHMAIPITPAAAVATKQQVLRSDDAFWWHFILPLLPQEYVTEKMIYLTNLRILSTMNDIIVCLWIAIHSVDPEIGFVNQTFVI